MPPQSIQRKPWTKPEKMLLGSVFGILALAALVVIGSRYLHPVSDLRVPTPVMPSPNAFDYYNAAGNSIQDGLKVVYAYSDFTVTHHGRLNSLTKAGLLVRENRATLKTLRKGLAYSYLSPPMRSINDKAPYLPRERDRARLLAVEGQVRAAQGDWNGAVQSDLDAIQMGQQIPHGAVIIGDLVGFACQAIGRRPLWAATEHLSAAQAKAAGRRLDQIQAAPVPNAQTLQEEEWFGQAAMLEQFRLGNWGPVPEFMQSIYLRRYTRYMDQCIANARLPYAAKPPAPEPPEDIVNAIFAPVLLPAEIKDTDNRTQNSLLLVHLALRAYRVEHHKSLS